MNSDNATVIGGSVTYTTNFTAATAAGTSGITITPDVTGLTATNYTFSSANGNITITKAESTITASGTTSFQFNGAGII